MKTRKYGNIKLSTSDKISRQGYLQLDTNTVLKDVGIDYSWKVSHVRVRGRPTSFIEEAEFKCTFILSKEGKGALDDFIQKNEKKELTIEFTSPEEVVGVEVSVLNGLLDIRNMRINVAPVL